MTSQSSGFATLDSTQRLPIQRMPIGSICQVVTTQTRAQTVYSVPASGDGTEVSLLNISITPRKAGNILVLEWAIFGETDWNVVFLVARNGALLPEATDSGNNRWAGVSTPVFDNDNNTTPQVHIVRIVDTSTLATASTYSVLVRSSSSTATILTLNRVFGTPNADIRESGLSTGIALEIMT